MKGRIAKLHLISKKGGKSEAVLFEFLQKYDNTTGKIRLLSVFKYWLKHNISFFSCWYC